VHVLGIEAAVKQLGVATPAVNVLLVLDRELDDQGLFAVGEGLELGRHGVELGILAGLDALALLGVAVKLSGGQDKLSGVAAFVRRADPSAFPGRSIVKSFFEVDVGEGNAAQNSQEQKLHFRLGLFSWT